MRLRKIMIKEEVGLMKRHHTCTHTHICKKGRKEPKRTKKKLIFKLCLALEFGFYFIAGLCCRWFASQGV